MEDGRLVRVNVNTASYSFETKEGSSTSQQCNKKVKEPAFGCGSHFESRQASSGQVKDFNENKCFSKLAWAVSCCSGPPRQTHMRTQGKSLHGTRPKT